MDSKKTDSYSQIRSNFMKNYKKRAAPFFKVVEEKRKKHLIHNTLLSACAAPVPCLVLTIGTAVMNMINWGMISVSDFFALLREVNINIVEFVFMSAGFFMFIFFAFGRHFERELKKFVMPYICECFGDINLKWFCAEDMTEHDRQAFDRLIKNSYLASVFGGYNRIAHDDIFQGIYGGVKFDINETLIERISGSGRHRHTERKFRGLIIKLDMNKSFSGATVIAPSGAIVRGLRKTELEDIEFEKEFDVYTDDEVEARYLITTAFMERFKEVRTAFGIFEQSCSFYRDSLVLALPRYKDSFSLGAYFKKPDYRKQCLTMIDEIVSIIKLIDHFKLDTKIGL